MATLNSERTARRRSAVEAALVEATTTGLVTLWRAQPVRAGGPVQAQVPASALDDWLARGWQQVPAPGEVDGA